MVNAWTRGRRRRHGSVGLAIALSFLFVSAWAGQHSHTGTAESPSACAVCASIHQAAASSAPTTQPIETPTAVWLQTVDLDSDQPRPAWTAVHRTRAPPVVSPDIG
ncbi:MAG: hypothetical protein R3195_08215 [Gemmatimonadota bacterium]|nr:hypothetical protein [Gemmatimonadota bacterium]